jgi:hypothetical protein
MEHEFAVHRRLVHKAFCPKYKIVAQASRASSPFNTAIGNDRKAG